MRKAIFSICIFVLIFFVSLPVNAANDYYKDINIKFNYNGCNDQAGKEITIQLFKNGEKEGDPVILNQSNNYSYTFEDLLIFAQDSPDEIKYDVKVLENGKYRLLSPTHQTHQTARIQKWVQVLYQNLKEGHTYVFTTDNWNYESNGFSQVIYLRGDITAKGASILPEYNIINGMQSYYVIDGEPIDNTKWVASKVPSTDPDYNLYKGYWMFTNESEGKKLTLTGYLRDDGINYIFKRSGNSGFVSETEYNSNRVQLTYVDGSKGRFYIGTFTNFPGVDNTMQYITLSGQNQYQAGSNIDRAAQFKAYEYVDAEVEIGQTVNIEESMCPTNEVVIDRNSDYKRDINVKFDCKGCEGKKDKGITIQLFADGKKVQDGQVKLNSKTGFDYTFKDLPVFYDDNTTEIKYEVKVLNNGKYYAIPTKNITNQKVKIKKWVQALPEKIKSGNTYLLVAEYPDTNVNRYYYLRGDISSKRVTIDTEYNVIDGEKLYYVLRDEPAENTKWTVSDVPSDDPDYNSYKNYLMFTNENEDKKLTLTAYISNDGVNWIYKRSGNNGYVYDDELNTNRVLLTPASNSNGKFYISTYSLLPSPYNATQYVSMNSSFQFQANSNIENATKFIAYEYIDKEITVASQIVISVPLCEALNYGKMINPDTGLSILIILLLVIISSVSVVLYKRYKNNTV